MTPRSILGIVTLAALIACGWLVQRWHDKAGQYDAAVEQREQLRADFNLYRDSIKQRDEASRGYQHELQDLRTAMDHRPVPVVRLCQPTAAVVPAAQAVAAGPGRDANAAAGVVHESAGPTTEAGPDIGPDLYRLAHAADELSAWMRATKQYMGVPDVGQ